MNDVILFVDDDINVLEGYKTIFTSKSTSELDEWDLLVSNSDTKLSDSGNYGYPDYDILVANQGKDGAELVMKQKEMDNPVKVVFIDMRMPPGIDGAETAKLINRIDPDVEIVIVTAYSDTKLEEINNRIGQPDKLLFLKKPFDPLEVKQIAHNLVNKYKLMRQKDEFIAHVSHELSTPLSSILGFSELLSQSDELNEEDKLFANIVNKNSILMKELIEELLEIARMKGSTMDLIPSETSLSDIFEDIKNSMKFVASDNDKVAFEVESLRKDLSLNCDRNKLKRAICSLVSNGLKFTKEGYVKLNAVCRDNELRITVNDTGAGIPEEKLDLIFEKFSRIEDKHHLIPGLGLGLPLAKSIIEAHGGTIEVDSTQGEGSSFTICLSIA